MSKSNKKNATNTNIQSIIEQVKVRDFYGTRKVFFVLSALLVNQLGSALTYARRYSIQSVLGVAAEDDDDGNAASASKGAAPAADPF